MGSHGRLLHDPDTPPFDLATLLTAIGILLAVALCAGLIPGSRATRISPVQALWYE